MTELPALVEAMCQGTATLADRDRLESLLRDPANRAAYLRASRLHAELLWRWHHGRVGAFASNDRGRGLGRSAGSPGVNAAGRPASRFRGAAAAFAGVAEWLSALARGLARPVPLALLVVGGLLAGGLGIAAITAPWRPVASQGVASGAAVARITGLCEATWRGRDASFAVADPLAVGTTLDLESGLVEIRYDSGATVLLEGPAVLRVEGRSAAWLPAGRLTAKFEQAAADAVRRPGGQLPRLFTVQTPKAAVHDLGTEFGVEVRAAGDADVHVFEGLVEMVAADPAASASRAPVRLLAAGDAARIDESGRITPTAGTGLAFVRSLRTQPGTPAPVAEGPIPWDDASAEILYHDTFRGSGTLDGTSPASRGGVGTAVWRASGSAWGRLESAGDRPGLHMAGGGHALLPFRPEPGYVYKLTVSLDVTAGGLGGVGFGMRAEMPSRYVLNVATSGQRHECAADAGIYSRNGCFPGPGNEWRLLGDDLGGPQTRVVLLDTTGDRWRVAFRVGDQLVEEHVYAENPATVTAVGLESSAIRHVRGYVSSFTLARSQPLPESRP